MTDQDIFRERAEAYANIPQSALQNAQRCLEVCETDKCWSFRESEVSLVLPEAQVTRFPRGARWGDWPCLGLICQALTTLPLLCWSEITNSPSPSSSEHRHFLILRDYPIALRVAGSLALTSENLGQRTPELEPWSAGRLASGASLVNLDRLQRQGPV